MFGCKGLICKMNSKSIVCEMEIWLLNENLICEMEIPDFKSEICVENSATCKDESTT